MGERDDARGSIEPAEPARSLSATGGGTPTERGTIEQTRDRMTTIVEELARRATPGYVGEQIKEATVKKTKEMRERAVASPYALPLLGGAIGAIVGGFFSRQREASHLVPRRGAYEYGRIEEVTGYGEMDSGESVKDRVADKARELKDGVVDTISGVGERSSEAIADVRVRAVEASESAKSAFWRALDEQPLLVGAGMAVIGALAAMLAPVPEKEKQLVEPARRKASEGIQKLGEKLEEKLEASEAKPDAKMDAESDLGELDRIEIDIETGDRGDSGFPPAIH